MLCDSGIRRDNQSAKLDGWLLKVNKHVAPLTPDVWIFCTEMSPSTSAPIRIEATIYDTWCAGQPSTTASSWPFSGTLELIPGDLELLIDHVWCCIDPIDPSSWLTMSWSWSSLVEPSRFYNLWTYGTRSLGQPGCILRSKAAREEKEAKMMEEAVFKGWKRWVNAIFPAAFTGFHNPKKCQNCVSNNIKQLKIATQPNKHWDFN